MMAGRALVPSSIPPLFAWRERAEIDRLEEERKDLAERISRLPRLSHRRVELEARLRDLTGRQLELDVRLRARP